MNKRPHSITVIGWVFTCVGCASLVAAVWRFVADIAHAGTQGTNEPDLRDLFFVLVSAVVAAVGGAFVLRGRSWAPWVCVVWLGFHVILSIAHPISELVVHSLLFAGITYLLFRPRAAAYFRATRAGEPQSLDER